MIESSICGLVRARPVIPLTGHMQHFRISAFSETMPLAFFDSLFSDMLNTMLLLSIYPNAENALVRLLGKGGIHSFTTPSECCNLVYKDHAWMFLVQIVYGGCTCSGLYTVQ